MEQVNTMDEEENLKILSYVECGNESPEGLKKMRGVVQEVDTGNVLFDTFPYTDEYDADLETDREKLVELLKEGGWEAFYSLEGALIRVFWYKTRWYVTTNKKLNAFKSHWSSRKSFGEMFAEGLSNASSPPDTDALEKMLASMDKTYVYFFLVGYNQENRIVCRVGSPVVFIGRWNKENPVLDREWKHTPSTLSSPSRIEYETVEEMMEKIRSVDIQQYQGIILFHKKDNRQIKIYSPGYKTLCDVRGNNPNIRFRYLEVRNDPNVRKALSDMYPIYQDMFLESENIIYQIAKLVRFYYIQRYIKNKYVTLPKEEYILMKKCHEWYLSNREENKITVTKVYELLNKEETVSLYKMIRRFQISQSSRREEETMCEYPGTMRRNFTNIEMEIST